MVKNESYELASRFLISFVKCPLLLKNITKVTELSVLTLV